MLGMLLYMATVVLTHALRHSSSAHLHTRGASWGASAAHNCMWAQRRRLAAAVLRLCLYHHRRGRRLAMSDRRQSQDRSSLQSETASQRLVGPGELRHRFRYRNGLRLTWVRRRPVGRARAVNRYHCRLSKSKANIHKADIHTFSGFQCLQSLQQDFRQKFRPFS